MPPPNGSTQGGACRRTRTWNVWIHICTVIPNTAGISVCAAEGSPAVWALSKTTSVADHTGFYGRYGREFLCRVLGDDEEKPSRMYIRR